MFFFSSFIYFFNSTNLKLFLNYVALSQPISFLSWTYRLILTPLFFVFSIPIASWHFCLTTGPKGKYFLFRLFNSVIFSFIWRAPFLSRYLSMFPPISHVILAVQRFSFFLLFFSFLFFPFFFFFFLFVKYRPVSVFGYSLFPRTAKQIVW